MINRFIIALTLFVVVATQGHAQNALRSGNKVVYDPLFWKTKLKLKKAQCDQISDINASFYKSIKSISGETNREAQRALLDEILYVRSEKLWNVLSGRQKHRWQSIKSFRDI